MTASPRCAALLRNGQSCGRTVAADSEFCVHHTKLLATVDADEMKKGKIPKARAPKMALPRVVADDALEGEVAVTNGQVAAADPSSVRPLLALAAAENL